MEKREGQKQVVETCKKDIERVERYIPEREQIRERNQGRSKHMIKCQCTAVGTTK